MKNYQHFMDEMLETFCLSHEPCRFQSASGTCVISRASHSKGHQNSRGTIFAAGDHISTFTYERYQERWESDLTRKIVSVTADFSRARGLAHGIDDSSNASSTSSSNAGFRTSESLSLAEKSIIKEVHGEALRYFYQQMRQISSFKSHSTCFCCFVHAPQHILFCPVATPSVEPAPGSGAPTIQRTPSVSKNAHCTPT